MACVWCEGDAELHEQLFNTFIDVDNTSPDNLRRALADFYHCSDCISTYHRVKPRYVKNQEEYLVFCLIFFFFFKGKKLSNRKVFLFNITFNIMEIDSYPNKILNISM